MSAPGAWACPPLPPASGHVAHMSTLRGEEWTCPPGAVLVTRLLAQARRSPDPGQLALAMISIAGGMGTAALLGYARLT